MTARDLTDALQNQAVLDLASALFAGDAETADRLAADLGPAVLAEAQAAARSREQLAVLTVPVHLSVVWAMYAETGRMVPRTEHPHGEDFVRAKAAQLDWLTGGLPGMTWSAIAVDDGCTHTPSSAELMREIVATEGFPTAGHRSMAVLELADVIAAGTSISPAFDALTSPSQSRKGGAILAGLHAALAAHRPAPEAPDRHLVAYTDADLSSNLAQLGALAAPVVTGRGMAGALGQRYGMPGAVLVKETGPTTEPQSTGGKPDKVIVLFRHFVRATLIPHLAHVLDTQAGFKLFDAAVLADALPLMSSFDETFDVELLIHLAQHHGPHALAAVPMVFTEDFAATNFPSVDPGARHLAMVQQVVELYDRLVGHTAPATGEAAELLTLLRALELPAYVRLIEGLRAEDPGDATLFDRRWTVDHLRQLSLV